MQAKRLLIAALVLGGLGGLLWWSEKQEEAKANKPVGEDAPKILAIPQDQFAAIDIKRMGAEPVRLENTGGAWKLKAPKEMEADQDAVRGLVSALAVMNAEQVVEEKPADVGPFGLQSPILTVTVTRKDGKTHEMRVGDDVPTGSAAYAQAAGDPRLYALATTSKTSLEKTWRDLRDKRLLRLDAGKLTRVELTSKGQTTEFGKNNSGAWTILKPQALRADNFAAEELVRKLLDAKMEVTNDTEEEASWPAKFATAAPVATARLTDANGTQQIEVRKDKEGAYFAKSTVVEGVFKTGSELGEGVSKTLDDFRNKKLFEFAFAEPVRVEVKHEGQAWAFVKSGSDWKKDGKTMDPGSVQQVVDQLRELTAIKFAASAAGAIAAEYSVALPDNKGLEKVTVTKQGNSYFARRDGSSEVLELDGKVVEDIRAAAASAKEITPAKEEKKK